MTRHALDDRDARRQQLFAAWLDGLARAQPFTSFLDFLAGQEALPGLDAPADAPKRREPEEPFHGAPRSRRRTHAGGGRAPVQARSVTTGNTLTAEGE